MIGLASKNNPMSCGTMMYRHTGMRAGVYIISSCASLERTGSRHNRPEASPEQILSDRQQVKPQTEVSILSDEN